MLKILLFRAKKVQLPGRATKNFCAKTKGLMQRLFRMPKQRLSEMQEKFQYNKAGSRPSAGWVLTQQCKMRAFSLVEMLMALLVASLLMAALAPVMTRRMGENINVSGSGNSIIPTGGCVFSEPGEYECEIPDNTTAFSVLMASGGGGGGGAAGISEGTVVTRAVAGTAVKNSVNDSRNSNSYVITRNVTDVEAVLIGGGGGGGGAWGKGGHPGSQLDCGTWGVYVGPEYSGVDSSDIANYHSICVSRYNPGYKSDGKASPNSDITGVTNVTVGTKCTSRNCCWRGATSKTDCETSGNGQKYSGCDRMVCQWNAANAICTQWKPVSTAPSAGKLPTKTQMMGRAPGVNYNSTISNSTGILNKYNSGYGKPYAPDYNTYPALQLCNRQSGFGALQCVNTYEICPGAALDSGSNGYPNTCYPDSLWADDLIAGTTRHEGMNLRDGVFQGHQNFSDCAYSVRCILDRVSAFSSLNGGGGGGGIYARVKISDSIIRSVTSETGVATVIIGAGNKGAGAAKVSGSTIGTAYDGGTSAISIYKGNSVSEADLVYYVEVSGGNKGNSATINTSNNNNSTAGSAGGQISNSSGTNCRYLNKYTSNTDAAYKTNITNIRCDLIENVTTAAGLAGNGVIGGRGYNNSGSAIISGAETGVDGVNYGSGGGGASCSEGSTGNMPKCTIKGGDGGSGYAAISYKPYYPGVGGGGGGAGVAAHVTGISNGVNAGRKIKVKVGDGGSQGAAGSVNGDGGNGGDGGESSIEYERGSSASPVKIAISGGYGGGGAKITSASEIVSNISQSGKVGAAGNKADVKISFSGAAPLKSNVFPANADTTKGYAGHTAVFDKTEDVYKYLAAGGNGGVNSKISPYGTGIIPCGGLSTLPVVFEGYEADNILEDNIKCDLVSSNSLNPSDVAASYTHVAENMQLLITSIGLMSQSGLEKYAGNVFPGASGGGGGAWYWDNNTANVVNSKTSMGAKGMPGYVIIYWNVDIPDE